MKTKAKTKVKANVLKEVLIALADETTKKDKGKLRFQKQAYNYKNWLTTNKTRIKDEFNGALAKMVEDVLQTELQRITSNECNAEISISSRYEDILENTEPAFIADIKSLNIRPEDIHAVITNWGDPDWGDDDDDDDDDLTIEQRSKKRKVYDRFYQYIVDKYWSILREEGFNVAYKEERSTRRYYNINWGTLPEYYTTDKEINWVEVYDWVQLSCYHDQMQESLEYGNIGEKLNTTQTKKMKAFHIKKEKEYNGKIKSVFTSSDFNDILIDLASEYDDEINTWLEKVVNDKNIGKEPEKKLKLGDPR